MCVLTTMAPGFPGAIAVVFLSGELLSLHRDR
jgi:hypothetical protein